MKIFQLTAIILLLTVCNTFAQPIDSLKQEIQKVPYLYPFYLAFFNLNYD